MVTVSAIIAAAGQGKRMGGRSNKQFLCLGGRPLLLRTLQVFEECPLVDEIIPVVAPGEEEFFREIVGEAFAKISRIAPGGKERQDSVFSALGIACGEIIMVHDGARPLVTEDLLVKAIEGAYAYDAAVIAVPAKDTIKLTDEEGFVISTPPRDRLWQIQTPQVFRGELLREAYTRAREEGFLGTDDASLVERLGKKVKLVQGSYENIKITTPDDLAFAESILQRREQR